MELLFYYTKDLILEYYDGKIFMFHVEQKEEILSGFDHYPVVTPQGRIVTGSHRYCPQNA